MLSSKQKKWILNKLIPGIIFFGTLIVVGYIAWRRNNLLEEYPRYTIGTTTETYWTSASGKKLRYKYKVGGKIYTGSNHYEDKTQVPARYFVWFSEVDPEVARILQDKPVPDTIKVAPPDGWKKLPL
ncbi:hypothetical protein [Pontibacter beigongshangensis]|uniref:hypothetical protein n=1 Tax=Pontibacter beigongshangensis TaxID=2574733 RepID=UPI00164FB071|nr:hypothetical protein [Pontibacter beigongshangensis]